MKSVCQSSIASPSNPTVSYDPPSTPRNMMRKIVVTGLTISMVAGPVTAAWADEGFMVMQYEFALSKKPEFRQLNLAYQGGFGATRSFEFEQSKQPSVVIPLYSTDSKKPGLFNRFDDAEAEEDGGSKIGIGAVLGALLGLGVVAAYAYAAGKCTKYFLDGPDFYGEPDSDSHYCEAL